MIRVRNLCFCGAVFAITPTSSIAQDRIITIHPETKYSVDGLAIGALVASNSSAYHQYICKPSEQYQSFTRCHESHNENGNHVSRTILHTSYLVREQRVIPGLFAADPSQMKRGSADTPDLSPDTLEVQPNPQRSLPLARPFMVPMEKIGDVYQVPIRINDTITLDAIVDSGASVSACLLTSC
jgi:hypothetical protein